MIFVYFVDLILYRPFQHATLESLMQASSFYSFRRPSLPHGTQIETLRMGPSQVIGGQKPTRFIRCIPSTTRVGNILLCWTKSSFISQIVTDKSGCRTMKIPEQLSAKRSAVGEQY
jgi:hypothetical protein